MMPRALCLMALAMGLQSAAAGPRAVQPSSSLDEAYAPRRVAILVGVDSYGDTDLDALSFAGKDARDMAHTLGRADAGGFDELIVLDRPEDTTRDAILARFEELTAGLAFMKGSARSLDLHKVLFEVNAIADDLESLRTSLGNRGHVTP